MFGVQRQIYREARCFRLASQPAIVHRTNVKTSPEHPVFVYRYTKMHLDVNSCVHTHVRIVPTKNDIRMYF